MVPKSLYKLIPASLKPWYEKELACRFPPKMLSTRSLVLSQGDTIDRKTWLNQRHKYTHLTPDHKASFLESSRQASRSIYTPPSIVTSKPSHPLHEKKQTNIIHKFIYYSIVFPIILDQLSPLRTAFSKLPPHTLPYLLAIYIVIIPSHTPKKKKKILIIIVVEVFCLLLLKTIFCFYVSI